MLTFRKKKERGEERRRDREDPLKAMKEFLAVKDGSGGGGKNTSGIVRRTGAKSIETMRQERIEREEAESKRTHEHLNPRAKRQHEDNKEFFNSQFNPTLIRKQR